MRLDFGASLRTPNLARVVLTVGAVVILLACVFFLLQRQATPQATARPNPTAAPRPATDVINTLSIADLESILTDLSYAPDIVAPEPGAAPTPLTAGGTSFGPYLKVSRRGYSFFVRFYDCKDMATATDCQTIEVVSGSFMLKPPPSAGDIISWNRQSWWAFAVADADGLPFLRSYFSTTGGVSEAFIRNFFRLWDWRVTEFAKFIKETVDSREGRDSHSE